MVRLPKSCLDTSVGKVEFTPKVSIVIPVYNGSNYLSEAIDSALAQTYKNIEIVVVNDGSDDEGKTEAIATLYGNKIRYFYKENGGVASALNLGIRNMIGEYFSWLSHDDAYYPDKIERQVKHLENRKNKQIITYCACEIIDENSNLLWRPRIKKKYLNNIYLTILSTSIGGCSLLVPKECFENVGVFNEKLTTTQDNEMWLRIAKEGFIFEYISEFLVKSRSHPEQGSNIMKYYHQKEKNQFFSWAFNFIGDDIKMIHSHLNRILLSKKIYHAHHELLQIKHKNSILRNAFLVFDRTGVYLLIRLALLYQLLERKILISKHNKFRLR